MADQLQLRGGTTAQHAAFTGALREVTVDTDKDTVVVHDNATVGGFPLLRQDLSNLPAGTIDNADINASAAIVDTKLATIATGGKVSGTAITSGNISTSGSFTSTSTVTGTNLIPTGSGVPTNGIYLPAANSVAVATNGTGRLFVDSAGIVGIGDNLLSVKPTNVNRIAYVGGSYSDTNIPGLGLALYRGGVGEHGHLFWSGHSTGGNFRMIGSIRMEQTVATVANGGGDLIFNTNPGTAEQPTERLRITSAGLVGIGNSSPSVLLDVYGTGSVLGKFVRNNTGGASGGVTIGNNDRTYTLFGDSSVFSLYDNTASATRFAIDSSGRCGIGVTGPRASLEISDGSTNTAGEAVNELYVVGATTTGSEGIVTIQSNDSLAADKGGSIAFGGRAVSASTAGANWAIINGFKENASSANYAGYLSFVTRASGGAFSERARLDSSGRLLVGTSSSISDAFIQIRGNASGGIYEGKITMFPDLANSSINSTTTLGNLQFSGAEGGIGATITGHGDAQWGTNDYPGRLVFSTTADGASSPTERMRITSAGLVGIGTTPDVALAVLRDQPGNYVSVFTNSSSTGPVGIEVLYSAASPNNTSSQFFNCRDSSITRAEIRSNGGLANFSANNANLSDRNAKKDISPATDTWDCIKEWEIVNYRYKDQPDDAGLNLGVIAQQVAESCPEVVTIFQEAKEATEDKPAQEERLGVKEQQMYWMAIKSLQEAQVRIESLEAKVAALESA
jgi:hypothetical protein